MIGADECGGQHTASGEDPFAAIAAVVDALHQIAVILSYVRSIPVVTVAGIAAPSSGPASQPSTVEMLNLLRALDGNGCADPQLAHARTRHVLREWSDATRHEPLTAAMDRAQAFMAANRSAAHPSLGPLYSWHPVGRTTHLAKVIDPCTGRRDVASGHMLSLDGLDLALDVATPNGLLGELAAVDNPLMIQVEPGIGPTALAQLVARLDPDRTPGRLALSVGLGRQLAASDLPALVAAVMATGSQPCWAAAPRSGTVGGVAEEVMIVDAVLDAAGVRSGGVRLTLTADRRAVDLALDQVLTLARTEFATRAPTTTPVAR